MTYKEYDKLTWDLPNEEASTQFGVLLGKTLLPPLVLTFSGDLGAGKTTIIRAMLKSIGIESTIKSPTFSLVESYACKTMQIHHFDLYRIHNAEELDYLGFRDYFSNQSICCIEWPEHAGAQLAEVDLRFNLSCKGVGRHIQMFASSMVGQKILNDLAGAIR